MRELKFKNNNKSFKIDADGVKIKPFLTWAEFGAIYELVLAQDNSFMRNYAKVVEFAKVVTNIDFDGLESQEIYDICAELGLPYTFKLEIEEFDELDRMIEKDESVYNSIVEVGKMLNDTLAKIELDKKLGGFMGMLNKAQNKGVE